MKNLFKTLALIMALVMVFGCFGMAAFAADDADADEAEAADAPALEPKDGGTEVTFTTGSTTGTYYGFGGVMAGKISEVTSTTVTVVSSDGSQANIYALQDGDANLGFVQSDVMAYAYNGERLFEEDGADTGFSTVAAMYMEAVQIVTLDPDIKTVDDLKGKKVSIGAPASGVYFNAIDVLAAYGMTEDDIEPWRQNFDDSAESLQDGEIDAAFIVAGAPTTAITTLAETAGKPAHLVSLDEEHIDALVASSPFYKPFTVPADAYGMDEDTETIAMSAVVIAKDDVADEDVYNFLCGVFDHLDDLGHDKAKELSLEFAASVVDVPYHPGAVAFFADKGIEVPAKEAE